MQLVYSLRMGGSEKVAVDISRTLDASAFTSNICALDLDGELAGVLTGMNIPHQVMHRKGVELELFWRLYRLFRRHRVDVVHTHHFTQLFYAAVPARLAGARIVHTEHEFFSYIESSLSRALIQPLSRLIDRMTVVGPEVAGYFTRTIGMRADRITVVPNGVPLADFDCDRDAARMAAGIGRSELVVGTVGRLEPEKDHATLLAAFADVHATCPQTRLVIVGDGSLRSELERRAAALGIAEAVSFLGYRTDIAPLLAAMDVFVLSSTREGLPISLIEAMAARRPVIASRIGSVNDLVTQDRNGLLVPAGDGAGFATAIRQLLASEFLRGRLGAAGRQTVERSFSLTDVVRTYESMYRKAVGTRHVWN